MYSYPEKNVSYFYEFLTCWGLFSFWFYYNARKKLTRFFACDWIYWLFWLFWEFSPPKSPLVERTKNFFCDLIPPPLRLDTPSSATWYPLLCDLIPPFSHKLPTKKRTFLYDYIKKNNSLKKIYKIWLIQ